MTRAVLLLSAAVTVYGFYESRLFSQELWSPIGLRRFLWFAAGVLAWSALMFLLRPRWYIPAVAGIAAAITVWTVGLLPLAAAVLVAVSSYALGRRFVADGPIAAVLGLAIFISAAGLAMYFRVNYSVVYLAALAVPIALRPRAMLECAALLRPREVRAKAAMAVLMLVMAAHWLVALKPEIGADALAMHLAAPAVIAEEHRWSFDASRFSWAVMPMGGDWAFTIAYLLGGEFAARLLNFLVLCAIAGLVYAISRSTLAAALFASTPLVQFVTGSLMVENVWAALLLAAAAAAWRFRDSGERRWLYVMAVLLGTSLATKFGSVAFLLATLPFVVREVVRRRAAKPAAAAAVLMLILAAPPYVTAWVQTGNPVFPFLNTVFRSPLYDTGHPLKDNRFSAPLSPATLYDATFYSTRYFEGQGGGLGFQYLLLLPLAVFRPTLALAIGLLFSVLTFASTPNLRYVYPALPLFTIAIAWAVHKDRAARAVAWAALALQIWFLPAANWHHRDFYAANAAERDWYRQAGAPARALNEYMNARHLGAAVLFTEGSPVAGLHARAYTLSWHTERFAVRLMAAKSRLACLRTLQEHGIRFFIGPEPRAVRARGLVHLSRLLEAYTDVERRSGTYVLLKLKDEIAHASTLPPIVAVPGEHDDQSDVVMYSGAWAGGDIFPRAHGGTVTYADARGASFLVRFRGSAVTYVFTRAFNRGIAGVEIDGAARPDLDLYAREPQWQSRVTYSGLGPGEHELKVTVSGRKHPQSTGTYIDVDAVIVE